MASPTSVASKKVQSEVNGISSLKSSVADRSADIAGIQTERLSRAEGLAKLKARPDAQTLEISHNTGSREAFDRKLSGLNDIAERGKAFKADAVRNKAVVRDYKDALLDRAKQQWKHSDPEKYQSMKMRIKNMDADHMHELQLGGLDHSSMLNMLDQSVNRSFGVQIQKQLAKMPDGTPITNVVEKGTK
jgi:hypothetical protein